MGGQWGLLHGCAREGGKVKVFMGGGAKPMGGKALCKRFFSRPRSVAGGAECALTSVSFVLKHSPTFRLRRGPSEY